MTTTNFKDLPSRSNNNGIQYVARFKNNYGASIVRHDFSYGREQGLWELAVIKYLSDNDKDWELCYNTPITDDVIGHLTENDVNELLDQIKALSAKPIKPDLADLADQQEESKYLQ